MSELTENPAERLNRDGGGIQLLITPGVINDMTNPEWESVVIALGIIFRICAIVRVRGGIQEDTK